MQVPLAMLLLHGPEDLSFDPGPEAGPRPSREARCASAVAPRTAALSTLNPITPRSRSPTSMRADGTSAPDVPRTSHVARGASTPIPPAAALPAPSLRAPAGMSSAVLFLGCFVLWSAALWALADVSLRRHAANACSSGWLSRAGLAPAGAACAARGSADSTNPKLGSGEEDYWDGAAARHWAAESYGFALQARTASAHPAGTLVTSWDLAKGSRRRFHMALATHISLGASGRSGVPARSQPLGRRPAKGCQALVAMSKLRVPQPALRRRGTWSPTWGCTGTWLRSCRAAARPACPGCGAPCACCSTSWPVCAQCQMRVSMAN